MVPSDYRIKQIHVEEATDISIHLETVDPADGRIEIRTLGGDVICHYESEITYDEWVDVPGSYVDIWMIKYQESVGTVKVEFDKYSYTKPKIVGPDYYQRYPYDWQDEGYKVEVNFDRREYQTTITNAGKSYETINSQSIQAEAGISSTDCECFNYQIHF